MRNFKFILLVMLAIVSLAGACATSPAQTVTVTVAPPAQPATTQVIAPIATSAQENAAVTDSVLAFWNHAMSRQWDKMYSMLYPYATSSFSNEGEFSQQMEGLFQSLTLTSFSINNITFRTNQNGVKVANIQMSLLLTDPANGNAFQTPVAPITAAAEVGNSWMPYIGPEMINCMCPCFAACEGASSGATNTPATTN